MAAASAGCLRLWREENDALAAPWRRRRSSGAPPPAAAPAQAAFRRLLRKLHGAPPAPPALPLELTVLCNSLLLDLALPAAAEEELSARADGGLGRVLEAHGVPGGGLSPEERWQEVLRRGVPGELQAPLHHLAALQGLLWLAAGRRGAVEGLCRQLRGAKDPGLPLPNCCANELLSLLQGWHPADQGESGPLVVQSARDLKDILWTSAAFLQGLQELGAGSHDTALAFLQAAASGLCSKGVLAQIFTLMGCCNLKMGKPQTAIQCLKRSLQVDCSFLPALRQAASVYGHLGLVEAELEALALLDQGKGGSRALPGPLGSVARGASSPACWPDTSWALSATSPRSFPLQACKVLREWLPAPAASIPGPAPGGGDHYREGPFQGFLHGELAWPRVPEVFLEAASALEEAARHQEAIAVCREVIGQTSKVIPKELQIDVVSSAQEDIQGAAGASLGPQERESLRCILWRAAAYLLQGCAWARLGEGKEAISLASRCLQDLLRIQFINTGGHSMEEDMARFAPTEAKVLPQIRQLALTVRGVAFLELGRQREALMDFQHSLHFCPESPTAHCYLLHTLWKLGRRQEALARWHKFRPSPGLMEEEAERPSPHYLRLCMKWMTFPHMESLAKDLEMGLGESSQEP
ncbi:Fanconi anemia group G protein isoform X2 [Paroedura picta]|uniref:Fanconi anemia group G protein isoform X2 n=1 Tax=Paroedura picta TaxID=143630 RepID=UPI0040579355